MLAALVCSSLALTACGGNTPGGSGQAGGSGGDAKKKAALIVAQGGLGDGAFNDLGNKGFKQATQTAGIQGSPIESQDVVAQGEQLIRRAGSSGYGLVVDMEFSHGDTLKKVAPEYPDVNFAIVNTVVKAPNVASILFKEHEGSYLAGALAAGMTSAKGNPKINAEKKIGVVAGTKSTGIDKFVVGFAQGAKAVDPAVKVDVKYIDSFGDVAKGKQAAEQLYGSGSDIVFGVAGGAGMGVIEAAKESKRYAIGVDTDQDAVAKGSVLTSMVKHTDKAVAEVVQKYAAGSYPKGQTLSYGLKEDGVGLSEMKYTKGDVPADLMKKIDQITEDIRSGKTKVWDVTEQGYPSWYKS